jgi:hypothetical protein
LEPVAWREGRRALKRTDQSLSEIRAAADAVEAGVPERHYFGAGWFSAPGVGLLSDVEFQDLYADSPCVFDPDRDVLVWDHDAATIVKRLPKRGGALVFEKVADFGLVRLFSIGPAPGVCPVKTDTG